MHPNKKVFNYDQICLEKLDLIWNLLIKIDKD